jgi:hypothetical protein
MATTWHGTPGHIVDSPSIGRSNMRSPHNPCPAVSCVSPPPPSHTQSHLNTVGSATAAPPGITPIPPSAPKAPHNHCVDTHIHSCSLVHHSHFPGSRSPLPFFAVAPQHRRQCHSSTPRHNLKSSLAPPPPQHTHIYTMVTIHTPLPRCPLPPPPPNTHSRTSTQ